MRRESSGARAVRNQWFLCGFDVGVTLNSMEAVAETTQQARPICASARNAMRSMTFCIQTKHIYLDLPATAGISFKKGII
jgi:hypothetical protein